MLIMVGMNRANRQASSGRAQNGGKAAASKAVRKDKREDAGKLTGKLAAKLAAKDAAPRLPLGEEIMTRPTFRRERAALKRGVWPIAGCDEAGRGPLAGPVVAAAVILDPDNIPRGLDDSLDGLHGSGSE